MEALKPQDVAVALKFLLEESRGWTYPGVAAALHLSSSTVHEAAARLAGARLFNPVLRRVSRRDFLEFLEHGIRFAFPAAPRGPAMGLATGCSAPPLADKLVAGREGALVWAQPQGHSRGLGVEPLYEKAPSAAKEDTRLYELLALVDALRVGRARERELAFVELRQRLS